MHNKEEVVPVHGTRKRVKRIIGLAMDIKDDLGHDVFVDYSPHVNQLGLRVYLSGWKTNKACDRIWSTYLSYRIWENDSGNTFRDGDEGSVLKELDNMIKYLLSLYNTNEEEN